MKKQKLSLYSIIAFALLVLFALSFSSWLMFHTFSYDQNSQSIEIAAKCWSDFGAHIPLIRSFSMGGNFDRIIHFKLPEYPIFPGEPIRYHFIFYMIVGLVEKMGIRIDWALNIPSIIGFASLLMCIFYVAVVLFNNRTISRFRDYAIGLLSILFFLFNGTLSFLPFFHKHPISDFTPLDIVFNKTFPSFGPWDGGLVSAFWNLNIYTNQRHLSAGFGLGLGFIALLLYLEKKPLKHQLPYLFISVPLLSILPYFHQPMLLILGIFMIWYFLVFANLRIFLLLTGLLAEAPIILQLFSYTKDASSVAWYPGYLIHGNLTPLSFLTYWFHNLGVHLILIPIGFLIAPLKVKKIVFPVFILFVAANLFKFSVEIAANHKFFNFFMIFGNMLSAYVIMRLWTVVPKMEQSRVGGPPSSACSPAVCNDVTDKNNTDSNVVERLMKSIFGYAGRGRRTGEDARHKRASSGARKFYHPVRYFLQCMAITIIFSLTLSGIIDFFPVFNDRKIPIVDIPRNEIALWIAQNTPNDAVFLNTRYLYDPASIAGRSIFLGWPYFPWSAGYKENRMLIMKKMYESKNPNVFCPLLRKHNISYITVEAVSDNPDMPTIDPLYFRSLATPQYENAGHTYLIFSTSSVCKKTE